MTSQFIEGQSLPHYCFPFISTLCFPSPNLDAYPSQILFHILQPYVYSSAIDIDTSVNTAFTADKLNIAKSYVDMYTINMPKHSSLV